jgi:hypothetical protein
MKKTIPTHNFHPWLCILFFLGGALSLSAQNYQLTATGPPSIQSRADDAQIRFMPNNQAEYYITHGRWKDWSIGVEWGAPQITYQPDGQLLSIDTRAWILNAGTPSRGVTISVFFQGVTDRSRVISDGSAFAGFAGGENRYVNGYETARVRMTDEDEPEITASVLLTDGGGTTAVLASYTFRRTDVYNASSITLREPEITHNVLTNGEYWMNIRPVGWIAGFQGRTLQLVARFYYSNETSLRAAAQETDYRDVAGLVAAASTPVTINTPTMDLRQQTISIPYRALNLPSTGGQASYNLFLFVDVFVDGQLQKQSVRVPFTVSW